MELYNLGKAPWDESQLIYHALASLGRESLCLVSPSSPYVCIGFHQDAAQEVDLDFCRAKRIPLFRRDLGGGAVYLDGNQLFFQLVLGKDNPALPKQRALFYRKFLQPIIDVYRRIGIPAEFKPVNDVVVGTRKISGTGVGEIGDCIVFVGNLILDFDFETMSRVLKVPDEKFRDKVHKTLLENLTTIRRELGRKRAAGCEEAQLNAMMAEAFQKVLGPMTPAETDRALTLKMDELSLRMSKEDWLFRKGKKVPGRDIKIRAGMKVVQKVHKAPGGLIRSEFEVRDGSYWGVVLSGDFFCFPEEGVGLLEARLEGAPVSKVREVLSNFFSRPGVETPGVEVDDWAKVLEVKADA